MKQSKRNLRWSSRRTYWIVRRFVRLLALLLLLVVCAFLFLRTYGVPRPLLNAAMRKANAAGIPIQIEDIKLTIHGWKATQVHYYSKCPDDLEPIIRADEVLFKRTRLPENEKAQWVFNVEASHVDLAPSVEWGVDIPLDSASRSVESLKLTVAFLPDRILINNGQMKWMGFHYDVNGTILKPSKGGASRGAQPKLKTLSPVLVTQEQVQRFENWLASLMLHGDANVSIDFMVDTGDYANSHIDWRVHAEDMELRNVMFPRAGIYVHYSYPVVKLHHASLVKDNQMARIEGEYDVAKNEAKVSLSNSITSKKLLLLLPRHATELLAKAELRFESLPCMDLLFGPAPPMELLNTLSGSFSIGNATYRNLTIDSMSGKLSRKEDRLEFSQMHGTVLGQEKRAEELGSCMVGGPAEGSVYWDAASHEFGVVADINFDPNLLVEPLTISRVATNVIRRFWFDAQPPQTRVELGANYDDWKTFFINIHCNATDVRALGVPFSSVNTSTRYKQGVLTLDPVVAMRGTDFIKGTVSIDFHNAMADFDAQGSLSPAVVEDVIYPRINLFGDKIKTPASTKITAHGRVDWRTMKTTDFAAEVDAERVETPIVAMDRFSAKVSAKGPALAIRDASFKMYDGEGTGTLTMLLNPHSEGVPYTLDFSVADADFNRFLQYLTPKKKERASGRLSGKVHVEADFAQDFFDVANGNGKVDVEDGQLADLPLFSAFSRMVRKIIPSFSVFSINRLTGSFSIKDGVIYSDDTYFDGDIISAKGHGSYAKDKGFDAIVQAQILSENAVSKVFRLLTDPILKFFELRLEGPLSNPSWRFEKLPGGGQSKSSGE